MNAASCLRAPLLSVLMLLALPPGAEPAVEMIMSVEDVRLEVDRTSAQGLVVVVNGTASSGGWTSPKLRPKSYDQLPADHVLDVDFVATRPAGNAIQVLTPVSAQITVPADSWVRGVRVHTRTNTVETQFGG